MDEISEANSRQAFLVKQGPIKFEYLPDNNLEEMNKFEKFLAHYGDRRFPSNMVSEEYFFHSAKVSGMREKFCEIFSAEFEKEKFKVLGKMTLTTAAYMLVQKFCGEEAKDITTLFAAGFWSYQAFQFLMIDYNKFIFGKEMER